MIHNDEDIIIETINQSHSFMYQEQNYGPKKLSLMKTLSFFAYTITGKTNMMTDTREILKAGFIMLYPLQEKRSFLLKKQ